MGFQSFVIFNKSCIKYLLINQVVAPASFQVWLFEDGQELSPPMENSFESIKFYMILGDTLFIWRENNNNIYTYIWPLKHWFRFLFIIFNLISSDKLGFLAFFFLFFWCILYVVHLVLFWLLHFYCLYEINIIFI